ncbi:MAG: hypothetical protein QOJ79_298 [Actinomycetota bacterium]|jgi:pimeloyl-ACP methyl ester carboxylesterase|nr:hypothetical protein [Actinomycetota bacterium]
MSALSDSWGTGRSLIRFAPTAARDPVAVSWYGRMERDAVTPGGLLNMVRTSAQLDYSTYLRKLNVPTLILHRRDEVVPVEAARWMASQIPGAELIELEGEDHLVWWGNTAAVVDEVRRFAGRARFTTEFRE